MLLMGSRCKRLPVKRPGRGTPSAVYSMSVNKRPGLGRSGGSSTATASASKKSVRAAEQDRPDVAAARAAWADNQPKLDADRLVFIDETGTSTKMARLRGRAPRGERLVGKIPHGHWKTTTFVAGLRSTALTAPCVIDGPMNGDAFLAYVEQVLAPTLKPGDIVVLDNLSAHKVPGIREAIEAAVQSCFTCLPIRRTSIRSSSSLPKSKPCCEKLLSARSRVSGAASQAFSTPSSQMNAPTTSATPDMLHVKWKTL
jgi:hypothetical protein